MFLKFLPIKCAGESATNKHACLRLRIVESNTLTKVVFVAMSVRVGVVCGVYCAQLQKIRFGDIAIVQNWVFFRYKWYRLLAICKSGREVVVLTAGILMVMLQ